MLPAQVNLRTWFPALDGLRCLAVLMVIFGHWLPIEPYIVFFRVYLPGTGVNLFFVLSGFLITRILLVQKLDQGVTGWPLFRSFYARRVLRIFPLYFTILGLGLLLAIPMAREAGLRLATFTLNIPKADLSFQPADLFNHFWSLCAEEQYYLFFPLLLIIVPARYLRALFIIMFLAGPLSRLLIFTTGYSTYTMEWAANNFTISCFDCFAAGSLLAWYFCYRHEQMAKLVKQPITGIVVVLLFAVLSLLKINNEGSIWPNLFLRTATSLFSCWLIAFLLIPDKKGFIQQAASYRWVVYIGKISYGIYVIHHFMPWLVKQLGWYHPDFHYSIVVYALLYAVMTFTLASLSWLMLERPVMNLKAKFGYRGVA